MANSLFYVGFCSSCETGPLGVRVCGNCDKPIILCDECDAIWMDVDRSAPPTFPEQPDLPCPHCKSSLLSEKSHWANRSELESAGWLAAVVGEGEALRAECEDEEDGQELFVDHEPGDSADEGEASEGPADA